MTNELNPLPRPTLDAPLERLLRDLNALGRAAATRPPAHERLVSALGDDLLTAVNAELNGVDLGRLPLCTPRRVA
jgi:hypothetical protein